MTVLRAGAATDVGRIRQINQDSFAITDRLYAVADGMGGHVAGEVASDVAITALKRAFDQPADGTTTTEDVVAAVHVANAAVFEKAVDDPDLRGMGTTMIAATLVTADGEERLAVANVGDSRGYLFSNNELTQLTEDHSVAEELVREGALDPSEVDSHPQRHILTRAMGILPDVDVDVWEVLPVAGDRIVLCSDGLVRELTDDQIAAVLRRLADSTEAAQELVARARAAGGADNITVVVVDVLEDNELVETASRATVPSSRESKAEVVKGGDGDGGGGGVATLPAPPKRRRITFRAVVFVVILLAVLGAAGYAVEAYARNSYYVTLGPAGTVPASPLADSTSRPILIYRGRPGGVLWFNPTLAQRTPYVSTEVCGIHISDLSSGHEVGSLGAATTYINNLIQEAATTCPGSGPTPTIPGVTTTVFGVTTIPGPTTTAPRAPTTIP